MLGRTEDWHSHLASAHKVTEWHTKAPSSEPPAATAHLSKSAWMGNHNMGSGLEYHAPDPETRVHTVLPDAQPELKCLANAQTSCHCDAWQRHNKKRKKKLKSQSGFVLSFGRHSVGVGKRTHTHTLHVPSVSFFLFRQSSGSQKFPQQDSKWWKASRNEVCRRKQAKSFSQRLHSDV